MGLGWWSGLVCYALHSHSVLGQCHFAVVSIRVEVISFISCIIGSLNAIMEIRMCRLTIFMALFPSAPVRSPRECTS